MKTPINCVIYMCHDKVFGTYNQAFFYHKKVHKPVYYVLTLNMCKYRYVSDLDRAYTDFCQRNFDCDTYDFNKKQLITQMKLFKEEN